MRNDIFRFLSVPPPPSPLSLSSSSSLLLSLIPNRVRMIMTINRDFRISKQHTHSDHFDFTVDFMHSLSVCVVCLLIQCDLLTLILFRSHRAITIIVVVIITSSLLLDHRTARAIWLAIDYYYFRSTPRHAMPCHATYREFDFSPFCGLILETVDRCHFRIHFRSQLSHTHRLIE